MCMLSKILLTEPGKLSLLMIHYEGHFTGGNLANIFLSVFFSCLYRHGNYLLIYFLTLVLLEWGEKWQRKLPLCMCGVIWIFFKYFIFLECSSCNVLQK